MGLDHSEKRKQNVFYFKMLYFLSVTVFFLYILKINFLHHISSYNSVLLSMGGSLALLPMIAIKVWGIRSVIARAVLAVTVTLATGVLIYISGGIQAPGLIWVCAIPILFGILLGLRWAVIANILILFFLIVLLILHQHNHVINVFEGQTNEVRERFISVILFMIFCGVTTIYVAWDERRSVLRLRKKHLDVENLLRALLHDVANGLSAMTYNVIRAREDQDDPEKSAQDLDRMEKSIDDIVNLLDQVRKIKAIKDGKAEINLQRVQIKSLVDQAYEKVQSTARRKNLSISCHCVQNSLTASVERSLFVDIVLCNLLTNAIKFSKPDGEIKISIHAEDDHVVVEIRDYGIGMPKSILNNIFRMDTPTTRQGTSGEKGTGYGMPLVREYLQMMQGSIEVFSQDVDTADFPRGTQVLIRLPRFGVN